MVQSAQLNLSDPQALASSGIKAVPQPATAAPATQSAAAATGDTVTLSAAAQAKQLLQQGHTVSQIAAALGTTTAVVDGDLGITPTTSTTTTTAIPAAVQALPATVAKIL